MELAWLRTSPQWDEFVRVRVKLSAAGRVLVAAFTDCEWLVCLGFHGCRASAACPYLINAAGSGSFSPTAKGHTDALKLFSCGIWASASLHRCAHAFHLLFSSCPSWPQTRQARWCKLNGLAAGGAIVILLVAALRVERQLGVAQVASHAALVVLAVALMAWGQQDDYRKWRNLAVVSCLRCVGVGLWPVSGQQLTQQIVYRKI
jgi:Mn2+/Fe2+ NRAMP family transporter